MKCFFLFLQQNKHRLLLKRISCQRNVNARYLNDFSCGIKRLQDKQRKLTILTLSMTCAFYLCWTPYAIHSILRIAEVWQPPRLSNVIAILFAKSGTVINPILYIFFNNDVSTLSIIIEFVICSYCIYCLILFYLLICSS